MNGAVTQGDKERWLSRYRQGAAFDDAADPYFGHPFDVVRAIRSGINALVCEPGVSWDLQLHKQGAVLLIRLKFKNEPITYNLARYSVDLRARIRIDYSARTRGNQPYEQLLIRPQFGLNFPDYYRNLNSEFGGLFKRGEFFTQSVKLAMDDLVNPTVQWATAALERTGTKNTLRELVQLHADEDHIRQGIPTAAKLLIPVTEALQSPLGQSFDSDAANRAVDDALASALAELNTNFAQESVRTAAAMVTAVQALAPGPASAVLTEDLSEVISAAPPAYARFGSVEAGIPAIAPFLNRSGWFVSGDSANRAELVNQVLLRTILQVPTESMRIRGYDPLFSGNLGLFAPLRDVSTATYVEPVHDSDGLRRLLEEVTSAMSSAAALLGGRGISSVGALWEAEGVPSLPLSVLVVLSYPSGIDARIHADLVRLAQSGASRGLTLLVEHDPELSPAPGVAPADLRRHLVAFDTTAGGWRCSRFPEATIAAYDETLPWSARQALVQRVVRSVVPRAPSALRLEPLVSNWNANPWSDRSVDALEATIGTRAGDAAKTVTVALRSENPPHSNLLVGGAVGQGKSNLLLAMIYAWALRYSPDELEMLLLDFKHGLEFRRLGPDGHGRNWLPHASIICLKSDKILGVAILEHVHDLLEARADLFLRARTNSFASYRRSTGLPLPRIVLVIDEFQVLFDGNDNTTAEAVTLLEKLARQGRAYGIHLVLSSQTLSGISALAVKAESIFAQFALRLSFRNTAEESQTILGRGNTAAAGLAGPGEVVVNKEYGQPSANEVVSTGLVESDFADDIQGRLWALDSRRREPAIFLGQGFAPWPIQRPSADGTSAYLGRPLAVGTSLTGFTFTSDTAQAVGVIGAGQSEATAVLAAIISTLTAEWSGADALVLLDGRSPQNRDDAVLTDCLQRARARGLAVDVRTDTEITEYLVSTTTGSVITQGTTLIIALHLQRIATMSHAKPVDPENPYGESISGMSALRDLVGGGSLSGRHVVGWWPNLAAMQTTLSFDYASVRRFVLARAAADDVRQIAGLSAPTTVAAPRVIVVDPDRGDRSTGGFTLAIPFDPWDALRA